MDATTGISSPKLGLVNHTGDEMLDLIDQRNAERMYVLSAVQEREAQALHLAMLLGIEPTEEVLAGWARELSEMLAEGAL